MELLLAIQGLILKAPYVGAQWLVDTGLLGVLFMVLALWPALAAGFYPEGIEDADDKSPRPDQAGEGTTQERPDEEGEAACARHQYDDNWRAGEDTD